MSQLIFDEQTMIDGNIFKFENRLKSHLNKYVENGATLVTLYNQDENSSTVDRGLRDIDELFGNRSPLRYKEIKNFPIYGFNQANPENTDEQQVEDINIEGDCIILPSTIVPKQYDCFVVNHLKMVQLFEITSVTYDSMKVDGYYKIHYRLHSTSKETVEKVKKLVVQDGVYHTDLNAIGSNVNPIIREDDFITISKIKQMISQMISSYKALFYNDRHNCFLYRDHDTGMDWFDMCGNEFMAKHGLMNNPNANNVVMLNDKLYDTQFPIRYHNSIYNWIELGAPDYLLQKFEFSLTPSNTYPYSSFSQWNEEVMIMHPLATNEVGIGTEAESFFDNIQLDAFMDKDHEPYNDYEKLIWKYIHKSNLELSDVSLHVADALITSVKHRDIFLYTPIIIYILREIIAMN